MARLAWLYVGLMTGLIGFLTQASAATAPATHVFKHIVIIIQENRTPDNLFGSNPTFLPGVSIATSGKNSLGQTIPLTPEPMVTCYDLGHTHADFENALLGFDLVAVLPSTGCVPPANPAFKYVDNSTGEVQPYFDMAEQYGYADRMFQTNQGPSFPAHQFLFGGTSAPSALSPLFVAENTPQKGSVTGCASPPNSTVALIDGNGSETTNAPIYPCLEHQTLSDLLDAAHISWHYYDAAPNGFWAAPNAIQHICQPVTVNGTASCQGPAWTNHTVAASSTVLADIQTCQLAAVSWITPTAAESDHASSNDGTGPAWVASVVNAVGQQPPCNSNGGEAYWQDTAIFITWDDWGGWYDHIPPISQKTDNKNGPAWGNGYTYGFRVPMIVVSAFTPAGHVEEGVHDFGSILYYVEQNFGLGFIGPGGSIYGNYADYAATSRQGLGKFFTLTTPRTFKPIAASVSAHYFQTRPPSDAPPDND